MKEVEERKEGRREKVDAKEGKAKSNLPSVFPQSSHHICTSGIPNKVKSSIPAK